jgi:hypothetical protein
MEIFLTRQLLCTRLQDESVIRLTVEIEGSSVFGHIGLMATYTREFANERTMSRLLR